MQCNIQDEQGYMIAEVLISAAIAAAVTVSIMTSMGTSARAILRAEEVVIQTRSVRNIEAALRAGIHINEVRADNPDFIIEKGPDPASFNVGVLENDTLINWVVNGPGVSRPVSIWVRNNDT